MSAALRLLLPVATAVAATFYLASGVSSPQDLAWAAPQALGADLAWLASCQPAGRGGDACADDAPVPRADWLAGADDAARRGSRR